MRRNSSAFAIATCRGSNQTSRHGHRITPFTRHRAVTAVTAPSQVSQGRHRAVTAPSQASQGHQRRHSAVTGVTSRRSNRQADRRRAEAGRFLLSDPTRPGRSGGRCRQLSGGRSVGPAAASGPHKSQGRGPGRHRVTGTEASSRFQQLRNSAAPGAEIRCM